VPASASSAERMPEDGRAPVRRDRPQRHTIRSRSRAAGCRADAEIWRVRESCCSSKASGLFHDAFSICKRTPPYGRTPVAKYRGRHRLQRDCDFPHYCRDRIAVNSRSSHRPRLRRSTSSTGWRIHGREWKMVMHVWTPQPADLRRCLRIFVSNDRWLSWPPSRARWTDGIARWTRSILCIPPHLSTIAGQILRKPRRSHASSGRSLRDLGSMA